MKITIEATGKVSPIEGVDFENIKILLDELIKKYKIKGEIKGFHVDYNVNKNN